LKVKVEKKKKEREKYEEGGIGEKKFNG